MRGESHPHPRHEAPRTPAAQGWTSVHFPRCCLARWARWLRWGSFGNVLTGKRGGKSAAGPEHPLLQVFPSRPHLPLQPPHGKARGQEVNMPRRESCSEQETAGLCAIPKWRLGGASHSLWPTHSWPKCSPGSQPQLWLPLAQLEEDRALRPQAQRPVAPRHADSSRRGEAPLRPPSPSESPSSRTAAPQGRAGRGVGEKPTVCPDQVLSQCVLEGRGGGLCAPAPGGLLIAGFYNTPGTMGRCHGAARENASWQPFPGTPPSEPPDHPGVPFPAPPLPMTRGSRQPSPPPGHRFSLHKHCARPASQAGAPGEDGRQREHLSLQHGRG